MINLLKFDKDNFKHIELVKKVSEDKNICDNVTSILYPDDNTYVICFENINVGILKINKEVDNCYSVDIGILTEYTLKNYGSASLLMLERYIDNFNKIILRTRYDNNKLVNCAIKSGFCYDEEETEKCINEGLAYLVLSKK